MRIKRSRDPYLSSPLQLATKVLRITVYSLSTAYLLGCGRTGLPQTRADSGSMRAIRNAEVTTTLYPAVGA